jgi:uncharacterized membrane protein required for colicin V production
MEGILVDILIISVFLITVGISTYRGFVKSAMGIAVIMCSFIAAKMFGGLIGEWIDGVFMFDTLNGVVSSLLSSALGELAEAVDGEALVGMIPETFKNALELAGADVSALQDSVSSIGVVTESNIKEISATIAQPISAFVSEVIGYLGVFIVGLIVFRLIGSLVVGVFRLPILRTIDRMLGFFVGTFTGFLLAWGFAVVFRTVMGLLAITYPELLPFASVDGTYVYEFFVNFAIN